MNDVAPYTGSALIAPSPTMPTILLANQYLVPEWAAVTRVYAQFDQMLPQMFVPSSNPYLDSFWHDHATAVVDVNPDPKTEPTWGTSEVKGRRYLLKRFRTGLDWTQNVDGELLRRTIQMKARQLYENMFYYRLSSLIQAIVAPQVFPKRKDSGATGDEETKTYIEDGVQEAYMPVGPGGASAPQTTMTMAEWRTIPFMMASAAGKDLPVGWSPGAATNLIIAPPQRKNELLAMTQDAPIVNSFFIDAMSGIQAISNTFLAPTTIKLDGRYLWNMLSFTDRSPEVGGVGLHSLLVKDDTVHTGYQYRPILYIAHTGLAHYTKPRYDVPSIAPIKNHTPDWMGMAAYWEGMDGRWNPNLCGIYWAREKKITSLLSDDTSTNGAQPTYSDPVPSGGTVQEGTSKPQEDSKKSKTPNVPNA